MKNMKLRKIICLLLVTCSSCSFFAGCTDDINNYEKQTAAEASNKVFISDKYASLAFNAQRTVEGKVANMDTLVAKLVVNSNFHRQIATCRRSTIDYQFGNQCIHIGNLTFYCTLGIESK